MNKIVIVLVLMAVMVFNVNMADAKKTPYESGFDHGCSDADIKDQEDRYIAQEGKGREFHTDAFMKGYNAGFHACYDELEEEDGVFIPSVTQGQGQQQTNRCGHIVIFAEVVCENSAGQGQQN